MEIAKQEYSVRRGGEGLPVAFLGFPAEKSLRTVCVSGV